MSLVAVKSPQTDVNGHVSKWQAVHHPIEYHVQRKDQGVNVAYPAFISLFIINMNGTIPVGTAVGDSILYISPGGETHVLVITSISGNNLITESSISGTEFGGSVIYLDTLTNYYVETEVFGVNASSTYFSLGTMRHKIDLDGIAKINVSQWLQSLAIYTNDFGYDAINQAMIGEGGKYSIRFKEVYDGSTGGSSPITPLHYWTNSAKQVQDLYGSNMGEYVPTLDDPRPNKAKFMTVFDKPTYFVGFPHSLNFIYSDNIINLEITREEEQYDINNVLINTSSENLLPSERFFNNRLMMEQGYPSSVTEVELWLETGAVIAINEVERETSDPADAYSDGTIFDGFVEADVVKGP